MKMNKLTPVALLAFAGAAFFTTSASAQFANGDLILAFQNGTTTSATDLEVNLGSSFNFSQNDADVTGLSVTDLQDIYGGGSSSNTWNSVSGLKWTVVGTDTTHDLFLADPNNTGTMPTILSTTTDSNNIARIYNADGTATANSSVSEELLATDTTSYSNAIRNVDKTFGSATFTSDYNFFNKFSTQEQVSSTGSSLDLYELSSTGATPVDLGTFTLGGNGVLSFKTDTVISEAPEPSTYMLLGLGAAALLFMRRRMKA
jgi:hypothetical protein